jgi:hypothetical protein
MQMRLLHCCSQPFLDTCPADDAPLLFTRGKSAKIPQAGARVLLHHARDAPLAEALRVKRVMVAHWSICEVSGILTTAFVDWPFVVSVDSPFSNE